MDKHSLNKFPNYFELYCKVSLTLIVSNKAKNENYRFFRKYPIIKNYRQNLNYIKNDHIKIRSAIRKINYLKNS